MYDTVIVNGRVIDPANGIDALMNVAIDRGRIARIGTDLNEPAAKTFDAKGKLVVPGLLDIHCHVFGPGEPMPVDPLCGVGAGVTTIVDAGSAGSSDIDRLVEEVVSPTASAIYVLLTNHAWPDGYAGEVSESPLDEAGIEKALDRHPGLIRGIKVALTPSIVEMYGLRGLESARRLCDANGLRVMLHVGDIGNPAVAPTLSSLTTEALDLLAPGDVLTHIYTPLTGGPLDENGELLPAVKRARDRGVIMDGAKGDYGFAWETARHIKQQGVWVDTVSSDLELYSLGGTTGDLMVKDRRATGSRVASESSLLEYLAYFLALGFPLSNVIAMCTSRAALAMGLEASTGSLTIGRPADVAVLDLIEGQFDLVDVVGVKERATQAFLPIATFKDGVHHEPGVGPHEWGFAPPRAA